MNVKKTSNALPEDKCGGGIAVFRAAPRFGDAFRKRMSWARLPKPEFPIWAQSPLTTRAQDRAAILASPHRVKLRLKL